MKHAQHRNNKFGFALLETALALIVILMLGTIAAKKYNDDLQDERAEILVKSLQPLQGAALNFLTLHFDKLAKNQQITCGTNSLPAPVTGLTIRNGNTTYTNVTRWRLTDAAPAKALTNLLTACKVFATSYAPPALNGIPAAMDIYAFGPTPASAPDPNAPNLRAIVYFDASLTQNTATPSYIAPFLGDISRLAVAVRKAGALTGMSLPATAFDPGVITFATDSYNITNPKGNVPGIVAVEADFNGSGFNAFLRRDGSLPMEGNLNMQGTSGTKFNINNAQDVNMVNSYALGNSTVGQNLAVSGTSTLTGATSIGSDLTVAGNSSLQYVNINRWLEVQDRVWVRNNIEGQNINARGRLDGGYIFSRGDINAQNRVDGGYIYSRGDINAQGRMDASYIYSRGNIYANNNIDANQRIASINGCIGTFQGCGKNCRNFRPILSVYSCAN